MTSLTIHLPDELVEKAQKAGLLQSNLISEHVSQFLAEKILQQNKIKNWDDFFTQRDLSAVPANFMLDREQDVAQPRDLFDDSDTTQ